MTTRKKQKPKQKAGVSGDFVMRLYVSRDAPNSVLASARLAAICAAYLPGRFKLEIIDVLEFPLRALADGILVTPSLTLLKPLPVVKLVGNLGNTDTVLQALGIQTGQTCQT